MATLTRTARIAKARRPVMAAAAAAAVAAVAAAAVAAVAAVAAAAASDQHADANVSVAKTGVGVRRAPHVSRVNRGLCPWITIQSWQPGERCRVLPVLLAILKGVFQEV